MQLESNIRGVAFSESWLKPTDDWHVVSPDAAAGERHHRKHSLASESGITIDADNSGTWWIGRNISKRILQRWALQRSSIRKAGRQGIVYFYCCYCYYYLSLYKSPGHVQSDTFCCPLCGKKRIAGLSYHEGSNFPRRSLQFAWRACVGLSQTSSQLALQVSTSVLMLQTVLSNLL